MMRFSYRHEESAGDNNAVSEEGSVSFMALLRNHLATANLYRPGPWFPMAPFPLRRVGGAGSVLPLPVLPSLSPFFPSPGLSSSLPPPSLLVPPPPPPLAPPRPPSPPSPAGGLLSRVDLQHSCRCSEVSARGTWGSVHVPEGTRAQGHDLVNHPFPFFLWESNPGNRPVEPGCVFWRRFRSRSW